MSTPSKARRMLAKAYRLVRSTSGKIFVGVASFPILRYIYNLIDAWGNFKMVTDGFPSIWQWIVWGWSYVNTVAGSIVVSAIGFVLIALQLHSQDRRALGNGQDAKPSELEPAAREQVEGEHPAEKPTIEILSPFDHDEVGLYETVRGRVLPPNQELQVVVFAGDKKWYPQKPVRVKGSTWSTKCQFGNLEHSSGGSYKVVALLGNELTGEMYSELPTNIPKSNSITVHRPEATTEQELKLARSERDKYKGQLQTATNAFADMEEQVEALTTEKSKLERELVTIKKDKYALEQSFETSQRQLSEARTDAQAKQENYELERTTILIGKHMLEEQLKETEKALKEEKKKANYETSQREEFINLYYEAERKLGDLGWLEGRMKQQAENLDIWVRIKKANRVNLQLSTTPRRVIIAFWVKNNSIFTVTFNFKFLDGCLRFKGSPLHDPIRPSKRSIPIQDVEPGACLEIILVQPLLRTEAETIQDARQNGDPNAIFSLADLNIPFFVRNIPQEVAAAKLKIHSEIEFMEASEFPCDKNVDELDIS